jgi:hypothetical protein
MSAELSEESPAFFFRAEGGIALMSTDVSEVCFLQVLRKMRDVKHSYESAGPRHRFEFPSEYL